MKTITLVLDTTALSHLRKEQTKLIHRAYVLARNGHAFNSIHNQLTQTIDGHLFRSAITRGMDLASTGQDKVIFGGRKNFVRRCKGLITNQEWKNLRSEMPLYSIGQANMKGNRRFRIDYASRTLTYKDAGQEYTFNLPVLKANWEAILEELCHKAATKNLPLLFSVGKAKVDITYDEQKLDYYQEKYRPYVPLKSKYLGIDLNPNRIGVAIYNTRTQQVVHAEQYELTTDDHDKRLNEISHICQEIHVLMRHYRVSRVGMEDLSVKSKDHGKGRRYNGMVNSWVRNFVVAKMRMICRFVGAQFCKINPAYSSFIGSLAYPGLGDCCAAAVEIARRCGYGLTGFYPKFISTIALAHRWKEMADVEVLDWVGLYGEVKKRHLGWRSPPHRYRSSDLGAWSERWLVHPMKGVSVSI